jgi:hypothetical protein
LSPIPDHIGFGREGNVVLVTCSKARDYAVPLTGWSLRDWSATESCRRLPEAYAAIDRRTAHHAPDGTSIFELLAEL